MAAEGIDDREPDPDPIPSERPTDANPATPRLTKTISTTVLPLPAVRRRSADRKVFENGHNGSTEKSGSTAIPIFHLHIPVTWIAKIGACRTTIPAVRPTRAYLPVWRVLVHRTSYRVHAFRVQPYPMDHRECQSHCRARRPRPVSAGPWPELWHLGTAISKQIPIRPIGLEISNPTCSIK